jgi:hypothetical protein
MSDLEVADHVDLVEACEEKVGEGFNAANTDNFEDHTKFLDFMANAMRVQMQDAVNKQDAVGPLSEKGVEQMEQIMVVSTECFLEVYNPLERKPKAVNSKGKGKGVAIDPVVVPNSWGLLGQLDSDHEKHWKLRDAHSRFMDLFIERVSELMSGENASRIHGVINRLRYAAGGLPIGGVVGLPHVPFTNGFILSSQLKMITSCHLENVSGFTILPVLG